METVLPPFYRWENQGSTRLRNLPELIQLRSKPYQSNAKPMLLPLPYTIVRIKGKLLICFQDPYLFIQYIKVTFINHNLTLLIYLNWNSTPQHESALPIRFTWSLSTPSYLVYSLIEPLIWSNVAKKNFSQKCWKAKQTSQHLSDGL